jgi:uncharacterized membrane protein YbhN (UPF0104 family)
LRRRPLKIFKAEVPLPPPWLSLSQIAVSCADLMVVAGVFYVLLPEAANATYFKALGVFLLGWVVAAFTHVPGGLGVFELIMVVFLTQDQVIAAALVFRAIYLLLPMTIAGCLLVAHELLLGRQYVKKLAHLPGRHAEEEKKLARPDGHEGPVGDADADPTGEPGASTP